jgi:hypothetical protein
MGAPRAGKRKSESLAMILYQMDGCKRKVLRRKGKTKNN